MQSPQPLQRELRSRRFHSGISKVERRHRKRAAALLRSWSQLSVRRNRVLTSTICEQCPVYSNFDTVQAAVAWTELYRGLQRYSVQNLAAYLQLALMQKRRSRRLARFTAAANEGEHRTVTATTAQTSALMPLAAKSISGVSGRPLLPPGHRLSPFALPGPVRPVFTTPAMDMSTPGPPSPPQVPLEERWREPGSAGSVGMPKYGREGNSLSRPPFPIGRGPLSGPTAVLQSYPKSPAHPKTARTAKSGAVYRPTAFFPLSQ